ncbi:nucleoside-triphosphatase [Thiobacillus denitrificans]|uniref:nucleoside-triphosphatase n=1 Tax=Thiobacillus denitrificans TaxID=36861 RepID=UPI00075F11FF
MAERLHGTRLGGFYMEELREAGARTGFRMVDFAGHALTFAHVDFSGPRVSRYGVDVAALDARAEALLAPPCGACWLQATASWPPWHARAKDAFLAAVALKRRPELRGSADESISMGATQYACHDPN